MKIVILGGGTAGWLAAYCISKSQPNIHNITVVESSEIGIIGAGEGSTGFFSDVLNGRFFDDRINIEEFVKFCDATNKIGIKFNNWNGDNHSFFTPLDGSPTGSNINDYIFKYVLHKFGRDNFHIASKIGVDYEIGRNYNVFNAFHFNAHKVGQFFKNICVADGITHIDSIVQDVNINSSNGFIQSVKLDRHNDIEADLFIDCSGFNRVLMKKLNVNWISFKDQLPLDSAMPFLLDYQKHENIMPWTTSTALSAGWMWDIPLLNRRGCGYVYNSQFISKENAKKEVEMLLGREIAPIKYINFDPGMSEVFWKNNVLSLGLASCFVEPLQATSIHTTISQLLLFINDFLTPGIDSTVTPDNEKSYNRIVSKFYKLNLDFVSMHYQGGRTDTPFWRNIQDSSIVTPYAKEIINRSKNKILGYHETPANFGAPAMGLWNWSMAGLGLLDPNVAYHDLKNSNLYEIAEKQFINFIAAR